MFEWFGNLFDGIGDWFVWAWKSCWDTVCGWWSSAWGVILSFFALVAGFFEWLVESIGRVFDSLAGIDLPSINLNAGAISGALAQANTFFPLNEACVYGASYFTLLIGLNIYKIVKSWIPTLS